MHQTARGVTAFGSFGTLLGTLNQHEILVISKRTLTLGIHAKLQNMSYD